MPRSLLRFGENGENDASGCLSGVRVRLFRLAAAGVSILLVSAVQLEISFRLNAHIPDHWTQLTWSLALTAWLLVGFALLRTDLGALGRASWKRVFLAGLAGAAFCAAGVPLLLTWSMVIFAGPFGFVTGAVGMALYLRIKDSIAETRQSWFLRWIAAALAIFSGWAIHLIPYHLVFSGASHLDEVAWLTASFGSGRFCDGMRLNDDLPRDNPQLEHRPPN